MIRKLLENHSRKLTVILSCLITLFFAAVLIQSAPRRTAVISGVNLWEHYRMGISNAVNGAVEGASSVKKQYWIRRDAPAAPKPNPECFGETEDPASLQWLIDEAATLLEGQELYFSVDTEILPGSVVRYYLDDTILAITWKQVMDYSVYTFSEVKIAHPSQFRRFLAGGDFAVNQKYTTTEMAQSVNSVVASSGDFYLFRYAGIVVYDGTVRRVHNGIVDTCYVDTEGDLHITGRWDYMDMEKAQEYVDENGILFSLAFGPALVKEGKVCTPGEYSQGEINDNYPRAALAQMDHLHYLLATVNSEGSYNSMPTIHTFARRIQDTGCPVAYALDGGQTAVIAMNGELINSVMYGYQRNISDIIYFATAIPD